MRLIFLGLAVMAAFLSGCRSADKIGAREDRENVPVTEREEERAVVTPTPIPRAPIDRPLDPSGRPRDARP
jgi:hypothetical protein